MNILVFGVNTLERGWTSHRTVASFKDRSGSTRTKLPAAISCSTFHSELIEIPTPDTAASRRASPSSTIVRHVMVCGLSFTISPSVLINSRGSRVDHAMKRWFDRSDGHVDVPWASR